MSVARNIIKYPKLVPVSAMVKQKSSSIEEGIEKVSNCCAFLFIFRPWLPCNHESVIYLPSGGLITTAGGNFVKIWDVIGGGELLHSMESHNKTVTALCMGKVARGNGDEAEQYRILSVGLDGYMKVFDYAKFKITHSMRFPEPLLSVGFSPDCLTRVIGTSKGNLYIGRRKAKMESEDVRGGGLEWKIVDDEPSRKVLRPLYFRYFQRGQNMKPSEGDYLIKRQRKVRLAEFDKMLKKFRHKEALASALKRRNPEDVVAMMEELIARKKLMKCVSNLEMVELGLLLAFLQKHSTMPRYAGLLTRLANKVVELRADDVHSSLSSDHGCHAIFPSLLYELFCLS